MAHPPHVKSARMNYDDQAAQYARNRSPHPGVLRVLREAAVDAACLLEVGVGSGNYLLGMEAADGVRRIGIDPSREMLKHARARSTAIRFIQAAAERIPVQSGSVDLAYSVDVIHHIGDRKMAAREIYRLLVPGGRYIIATDSDDDLRQRIPLTRYFPETLAAERARYPSIETIRSELENANFQMSGEEHVRHEYDLTDLIGYREKSYSSLRSISDDQYLAGLSQMERDLEHGPIRALSLYTLLIARKL
jgi:ubiquinone/menaquinone biosynthesis C-methylase UbiE